MEAPMGSLRWRTILSLRKLRRDLKVRKQTIDWWKWLGITALYISSRRRTHSKKYGMITVQNIESKYQMTFYLRVSEYLSLIHI